MSFGRDWANQYSVAVFMIYRAVKVDRSWGANAQMALLEFLYERYSFFFVFFGWCWDSDRIPAFAIGRTQQWVWLIRKLEEERKIPVLSVYLDKRDGESEAALGRQAAIQKQFKWSVEVVRDGAIIPLV